MEGRSCPGLQLSVLLLRWPLQEAGGDKSIASTGATSLAQMSAMGCAAMQSWSSEMPKSSNLFSFLMHWNRFTALTHPQLPPLPSPQQNKEVHGQEGNSQDKGHQSSISWICVPLAQHKPEGHGHPCLPRGSGKSLGRNSSQDTEGWRGMAGESREWSVLDLPAPLEMPGRGEDTGAV